MTGRRRVLVAAAAAGVTAFGGVGALRHASAGTLLCGGTPHIDQVSPHVGRPGDVITVTGSGFTSYTCALSLAVGGQGMAIRSQSDTTVTFSPPGPANGGVTLALTDPTKAANVSNGNQIYATLPVVSGVAPSTPVEGQQVTVTGQGFTFGGLGPPVSASGCAGGGVSVQNDGAVAVTAPGNYCDGAIQLSFRLVIDTATGATQAVSAGGAGIRIAPSVGSVGPASAVPGATLTVSGSGFGPGGSASVNGVAARVSWGDHSVGVTVPSTATSGPVTLVRAADGTAFAAGSVTVAAQIASVSPPAAAIGDTVTIGGAGFGPSSGAVHLGSLALPIRQWSPTSVAVGIPAGAASGPLSMDTVGTAPPTPASLAIVARLTGVSPAHAQAGALLQLTGTTLGSKAGTVSIGGHQADVALWSDQEISVAVPADARAGRTTISVTPAQGPATSIGFSVDAGTIAPATAAAALAAAGITPPPIPPSPQGPVVTHGGSVEFHQQRKPPSPINLTLIPANDQADPGSSVDLTASLVAYGKPVPGATIEMLMVVEPGTDVVLTPSKAVTDSGGRIHGSIRLSRTAGDHIILARSGLYSDEVRIRGGSEAATVSAAATVRRSLFWGITACVILLVLGFALNLATTHGAALAGADAWRARRPGPRGLLVASALVVMAVVRAGVRGWRLAATRVIDRLRRLRPGKPGPSPYPPM